MSDISILSYFQTKEAAEAEMLAQHADTLNRTFQIIYGVDATVVWEQIHRFSPDSNFALISGGTTLKAGTVLSPSASVISSDMYLDVQFIIPWDMLASASPSPYQLAETAKDISVYKQLVDDDSFNTFLKCKDSSVELLKAHISLTATMGVVDKPPTAVTPPVTKVKPAPSSFIPEFDLSDLTEDQLTKLKYSTSGQW